MKKIQMIKTSASPAGVFIMDKIYTIGTDIKENIASDFVRGKIAKSFIGKSNAKVVAEIEPTEVEIERPQDEPQSSVIKELDDETIAYYINNEGPEMHGAWYYFPDGENVRGKDKAQEAFDQRKLEIMKMLGMVE